MRGYQFYMEGNVKNIEIAKKHNTVKAKVLPSMKQKKYTTIIAFQEQPSPQSSMLLPSRVTEKTGPGGLGKCNHIGGILFATEAFNKTDLREQPTPVPSTGRLCVWNLPRNVKVEAQEITDVKIGKISYGKDTKFLKTKHYDPRAPHQRDVDKNALATFRQEVQSIAPGSMFLLYPKKSSATSAATNTCQPSTTPAATNTCQPSATSAATNACQPSATSAATNICQPSATSAASNTCQPSATSAATNTCQSSETSAATNTCQSSETSAANCQSSHPASTNTSSHDLPDLPFNDHYNFSTRPFVEMMDTYMRTTTLTKEKQMEIEEETRGQSSSNAWREVRQEKLTASNFKSAISCTVEPSNKIKAMIYNNFSTAATAYGNRNEAVAVEEYVDLIQEEHPGAQCIEAGLILSFERPWLGASVDRLVMKDGHNIGGLEVKCPFSKQGLSAEDASQECIKTFLFTLFV
ncbi:uncharacterized protein LOC118426108 [Branchiostoma floridae]|uniref:Uncharacterized protein LOC118426108 n=2 Tax=Branchiostoma floridae TaxID=7739 RepID=A0A9J7M0U4_BRAFL|nr:uncharacterized protein LOC118426108 [Branchiostoma floridae]